MARRGGIRIARFMAGIAARALSAGAMGIAAGVGAAAGVGFSVPPLTLNGEVLQLNGLTLTIGS